MLSTSTTDRLRILARAWNVTTDQAVSRLLDQFASDGAQDSQDERIKVHLRYQGQVIYGLYDSLSNSLDVTSGACAGQHYTSSSGAAGAVCIAINPGTSPHRNGLRMWRDERGRPISFYRQP
jgi:hypothetical protein